MTGQVRALSRGRIDRRLGDVDHATFNLVSRHVHLFITHRLTEAVAMAVELHAEQARKGTTTPYLGHLIGVCGLMIDDGGSEDEAIAAVLHDAVEDQGRDGATIARIRAQFGDNVASIVEACSDADETPKPPWRERKQRYIAGLGEEPLAVLRVSAADKLNNLRSIVRDYRELGEGLWSRFNPESDPLWYYATLLEIYEARLPGPLVGELRRTYDELVRLRHPLLPKTYKLCLDGGTLHRGFWLYVWEVTTPNGDKVLYVGRTGDSSSVNAQSPFNRMGQHLGHAKTSCMLRNHLDARGIVPEQCTFRLVAHGPILPEAKDRVSHIERRDTIGAMEEQLAEDLKASDYHVMNTVNCSAQLDSAMYAKVRAAFAAEFPGL